MMMFVLSESRQQAIWIFSGTSLLRTFSVYTTGFSDWICCNYDGYTQDVASF